MTKPNGKPCSRCGKSPKVGRFLCADCFGTCSVCGEPAAVRTNGQFASTCAEHRQINTARATCARCGNVRDGSHKQYCRSCYRDYSAEWAKANPERVRSKMRRHDLRRNYGITPEEWDAMLAAQGGTCAICQCVPGRGRRFHVDHCHSSGKVRSLLCNRCNVAIGMAGEDAARLRRMADYCESFA